jgi:hypothetical protein
MTGERRFSLPKKGGNAMCDRCVELDDKIEYYQRMASKTTDPDLLDGIQKLIKRMKTQKATLHPDQTQ